MDKKIRELATDILEEFTRCYSEADKDCLVKMIKKVIPENAVVLTKEEFSEKIENTWLNCQEFTRKETAEKFVRLVEFHSVATMKDNVKYFAISALALKEILHEQFGIPYDEICKELQGE